MITVKRWAADEAAARAGQQRHRRLDAAGQPDRDARARLQAARRQIGGEAVCGLDELRIGHRAKPIANGDLVGPRGGLRLGAAENRI